MSLTNDPIGYAELIRAVQEQANVIEALVQHVSETDRKSYRVASALIAANRDLAARVAALEAA